VQAERAGAAQTHTHTHTHRDTTLTNRALVWGALQIGEAPNGTTFTILNKPDTSLDADNLIVGRVVGARRSQRVPWAGPLLSLSLAPCMQQWPHVTTRPQAALSGCLDDRIGRSSWSSWGRGHEALRLRPCPCTYSPRPRVAALCAASQVAGQDVVDTISAQPFAKPRDDYYDSPFFNVSDLGG
jgi:hypothetical protein